MPLQTPHKYIAIDGAIGTGKTTVAKMLAEDLGVSPILEPLAENPFLDEFYKDREKNAFKTQLYFLLNRYQQQLELKQQDLFNTVAVCDYTFAKDRIFAAINCSDDELQLYDTIFHLLDTRLPKPDIVVYVQATPEVMMQRTKQRKLAAEKNISMDYLELLAESYNKFYFSYTETPLLIVNSNDLNIVKNHDDWINLRGAILEHRLGTAHYHFVSGS